MSSQDVDFREQIITPRLTVSNGTEAIEWYTQGLGAKLIHEVRDDKGQLMHGELEMETIGARFYIQEDVLEIHNGESMLPHANHYPMTIHLILREPTIESVWNRAVSHGAKVDIKLERHFWGSVYGKMVDPFGYIWTMSTPVDRSNQYKRQRDETTETEPHATKRRKLSPSAHEIRCIENSPRGLFMDLSVGKTVDDAENGATHANFKDAAGAGFAAVCAAVNEMGLGERIDVLLAILNDNPETTDPAGYSPGVILKGGEEVDWDGLVAKNDRFVAKDVPAGRWFVYCHGGPYEGLSGAWKKALEVVAAEHTMEEGWCHERYLNSPMEVSAEELLTEIWLKIS